MSCPIRRTVSLALLALAWALACGGAVRDEGNSQGGGGGSGAVTIIGGGVPSGSGGTATGATGRGATANASGNDGQSTGGSAASGIVSIFPAAGAPNAATDASVSDAGLGCAPFSSHGEEVVISPDILILLDRSQSMSCGVPGGGDRWTAVTKALTTFVTSANTPSDRNVGIEYFESETAGDAGVSGDAGASCNTADYETPDVPVVPLSQTAHSIVDSLGRHTPGGQTPTAAALVGALDYAYTWKENHQSNTLAVVLITDGEPDACGSAADVAHAASVGWQSGVTTFVIGLVDSGHSCNLDANPAKQPDLDAIAQSGGSTDASIVDFGQADVDTQIANALSDIRLTPTAPIPCRLLLPPTGPMGAIDPKKLNVLFRPSGAMFPTILYNVSGKAACDSKEPEWYYDNPVSPTEIDLCLDTCFVLDQMQGSIEIQYACGGPVPPLN